MKSHNRHLNVVSSEGEQIKGNRRVRRAQSDPQKGRRKDLQKGFAEKIRRKDLQKGSAERLAFHEEVGQN